MAKRSGANEHFPVVGERILTNAMLKTWKRTDSVRVWFSRGDIGHESRFLYVFFLRDLLIGLIQTLQPMVNSPLIIPIGGSNQFTNQIKRLIDFSNFQTNLSTSFSRSISWPELSMTWSAKGSFDLRVICDESLDFAAFLVNPFRCCSRCSWSSSEQ